MLELKCSICGAEAKFRNRDTAIDAGWSWLSIRLGKKRYKVVFCPKHSEDEAMSWLDEHVLNEIKAVI